MIKLLQWLIRIAGLGAFVLGAGYWFGHAFAPLSLHMTLGGLVALTLAILALWALFSRVRIPAALIGLLWAVAIIYVGTLQDWLVGGGGSHRVVQIIHPLLGIGAIGLGEMLAAAITRNKRASLA
jgi:hypothetical protein